MNSPGWHGGVLAESYIIRYAVGHVIDIPPHVAHREHPSLSTQSSPAVPQRSPVSTSSLSWCAQAAFSQEGHIGSHHDQVVV